METKTRSSSDTASEPWDEGLTCWRTASAPQCLRVETSSEIHLFPYGYFQYAKLSFSENKEVLQISFQNQTVTIKGKNLAPLCDALERLTVERIRTRPEKYGMLGKSDEMINEIEIQENRQKSYKTPSSDG